jgi:hypothetical protein
MVEYASSRLLDEPLRTALEENERQRADLRAFAVASPSVSTRELDAPAGIGRRVEEEGPLGKSTPSKSARAGSSSAGASVGGDGPAHLVMEEQ